DVARRARNAVGLQDLKHPPFLGSHAASLARGFSGTQILSTVGSSKEIGEPDHCGIAGGASQWFAYQAPASGTLRMDTDGSSFDTVLAVYTNPGVSFSTLQLVGCDNDGGPNGKTSRVTIQATEGTLYFIAVDGVNGVSGTVQLNYKLEGSLRISGV